MSLPPALLQRLAQRGLVQKQREDAKGISGSQVENEEVIAEDYDEMEDQHDDPEEEYQYPPLYEQDTTARKRDDNFWLERMKARMGEGNSAAGYKGCPNKYNIYHKCTLYCVNRWEDGYAEPSREYMRRFKRMLRKYPLPKGWHEIFDPGCGVYYFGHEGDGVVSWLSPTHPKSQVSKSAAILRRQLEENNGEEADSDEDDDNEENDSDTQDSDEAPKDKSQRSRSPIPKLLPQEFPSLHESLNLVPPPLRKPKSRDLERSLSRQRRDRGDDQRERERDRHRGRGRQRSDKDIADPMDPSSYSDIPRGKWSDGLPVGGESKQKKSAEEGDRRGGRREKRSDDESDNDYD